MARSVTLRAWQRSALDRLAASDSPDFLAVATPGAGKTTFALTAARQALASPQWSCRRVVVVVPTAHLKGQWAAAAAAFDLHLDPQWSPADGGLPGDMHGIVTTYQQVALSAPALRALVHGTFVVFDEIHHAADDRTWGDSLRHAFEPAARRLALSGTPFRSDTHAIPFVRYRLDEAEADYEYGYGDALRDGGVVRPVYFPRLDGLMEWSADGRVHSYSFDDALSDTLSNQRLRTAYSLEGEWLPAVLEQAHQRLLEIREGQPDAGGLVIASDQDHARGIARMLRDRFNARAVVAVSDDPDASRHIARFARGTDPWIVAVRMVSEGVDIPRLRVGVYATTTTTELFFRQAVGRLVRWSGGTEGQKSFLYIPDEPRLRARALAISEQRRHSLRHDDRGTGAEPDIAALDPATDEDEQLSLFEAISAVPLEAADPDGAATAVTPEWVTDSVGAAASGTGLFTIDLPPLPGDVARPAALAGADEPTDGAPGPVTLREHKARLRDENAALAGLVSRATGLSHAKVNAELNIATGVTRVSQATVAQLERRKAKAEQWLRNANGR